MLNLENFLLIILLLVFLYLGWKIKGIYKNINFIFIREREKKLNKKLLNY
mgnify:CR=1 FL=1